MKLRVLLSAAAVALGCAAAAPPSALSAPGACDPIDPSACLHPFPNDFFTVDAATATGKRVALPQDGMPKNRFGKPIDAADHNRADGFSPGSTLIAKVPGLDTIEAFRASKLPPIDDPNQSLAKQSPVVVINARTLERHLVWSEIDSNPQDPADRTLIVRPAKNFTEGERYIVALRNLKRSNGSRIKAGPAFRAFLTGEGGGERQAEMTAILRRLQKAGVEKDGLFLAWDFTIASAESTTGRMLSIRDRAFAGLGDTNLADREIAGSPPVVTINPDLPDDLPGSGDSPVKPDGITDYDSGSIARKIRGRLVVPCFLNAPGCPTGSQFQIDPDGKPLQIPGNTTTYDWSCNIPRTAHAKVKPLLYGHGLLGQQDEIDWGGNPDFASEHGYLYCAVDWNGMAFKDIPNVLTVLQDLSRFPTLVDHIEQGYLGFLFLGRSLIHPDGITKDPAFGGKVDTTELFYDGNSQGGIYGGALLAIAPDHERAVLGVPGMNYSTLLHRSVDFDGYAEGDVGTDTEFGLYDQYPNELERPLIFALMQMLWDRADPNGYAAHMTDDPLPNTPSHKALLQVGFGDHQVADVTTEVEARTANMPVHRPLLAAGRERYRGRPYPDAPAPEPFQGVMSLGAPGYSYDGSGVVFFDTGRNPAPWAANIPPRDGDDPHENVRRAPAAKSQKAAFLQTGGSIVDTCGGPCTAP